jgi:hypothetical protein
LCNRCYAIIWIKNCPILFAKTCLVQSIKGSDDNFKAATNAAKYKESGFYWLTSQSQQSVKFRRTVGRYLASNSTPLVTCYVCNESDDSERGVGTSKTKKYAKNSWPTGAFQLVNFLRIIVVRWRQIQWEW